MMSFEQAIVSFFKKFFIFSGRASRSEYWYVIVFSMGLGFTLGLAGTMMGASQETIDALSVVLQLILLVPSVSVGVRRLHDIDKSGWWHLIALIPILGLLILLYFFAQRGTHGDNRFGADPLALLEQH